MNLPRKQQFQFEAVVGVQGEEALPHPDLRPAVAKAPTGAKECVIPRGPPWPLAPGAGPACPAAQTCSASWES